MAHCVCPAALAAALAAAPAIVTGTTTLPDRSNWLHKLTHLLSRPTKSAELGALRLNAEGAHPQGGTASKPYVERFLEAEEKAEQDTVKSLVQQTLDRMGTFEGEESIERKLARLLENVEHIESNLGNVVKDIVSKLDSKLSLAEPGPSEAEPDPPDEDEVEVDLGTQIANSITLTMRNSSVVAK